MLRTRDFDHVPSDLLTQKRRLRRQRMLELALPCAIIAALLVACVFTVGHVGAQARFEARARAARAQTMLASSLDADASTPLGLESLLATERQPSHLAAAEHAVADAAAAQETGARGARGDAARLRHAQAPALYPERGGQLS